MSPATIPSIPLPMNQPITAHSGSHSVLIVEDDELLASLLSLWITKEIKWPLYGVAKTAEEALRLCASSTPDLVLLDLSLPNIDGIEAGYRLKNQHPALKLIVLSGYSGPFWVYQALNLGVDAFLVKGCGLRALESAMRRVMANEKVYDELAMRAMDQLKRPDAFHKILTQREVDIMAMLGQGLNDAKIAEELNISEQTVSTHRRNLRKKLQAHNNQDLILYSQEWGIQPLIRQSG